MNTLYSIALDFEDAMKLHDNPYCGTGEAKVYVIKHNGVIVYVGQTKQPFRWRMRGHMNFPVSDIGRYVKEHNPKDFTVDLYDCETYEVALSIEQAMIRNLKPVCNDSRWKNYQKKG
jgi:predicted GIY-YIG superfamily endonuclease